MRRGHEYATADVEGCCCLGGMDSRIIAAALAELQRSGSEFPSPASPWGKAGTRDVAYAERIAGHYGWRTFDIDADTLWDNVRNHSKRLFHSAMHLHAMPAVAKRAAELGVELMIAGSYGDSIGRAEYSGSHVSSLAYRKAYAELVWAA